MWDNIETLNDLIERLQEIAECDFDGKECGELPVRVAYQQTWPLVGRISAITVCKKEGKAGVWLAETPPYSDENPYAPRNAWEGGFEGDDFEADGYECDEDEEEW